MEEIIKGQKIGKSKHFSSFLRANGAIIACTLNLEYPLLTFLLLNFISPCYLPLYFQQQDSEHLTLRNRQSIKLGALERMISYITQNKH